MMEIEATISWKRQPHEAFSDQRYSRAHTWRFDGGAQVAASSSPHIVPLPYSEPAFVDPEEAYVASLSSCHMLVFLAIAARQGYVIDGYDDRATGVMEKNEQGRLYVSRVTLRPRVLYRGAAPDAATDHALHHQAHEQCFIANSVRTVVETVLQH
ncbi:peroxiredoxin [Bordetella genomosp. 7]|uniref:Peroxiredoxin n=1 Tax=Bordetella genomosp. 7 TaxID=1416805 RepID=A0A261QYP2_9BORD|nr:OsmC family protein [Bordetella genomosp. 7]OZI17856.1 peroxiredoxin [Bordetella genomosp. 7]OZI21657.1 peroxiredoxin [Bordetella genomosp. 7]